MTLTRLQKTDGYGTTTWGQSQALEDELFQWLRSFATPLETSLAEALGNASAKRIPPVDLYEGNDLVTVKAEIPGMKREDIDISLKDDFLVVAGERKDPRKSESPRSSNSERWFGLFERAIRLPYKVDAKGIKAVYTDGVLTVELPKAEEAKPKQIKIDFN